MDQGFGVGWGQDCRGRRKGGRKQETGLWQGGPHRPHTTMHHKVSPFAALAIQHRQKTSRFIGSISQGPAIFTTIKIISSVSTRELSICHFFGSDVPSD